MGADIVLLLRLLSHDEAALDALEAGLVAADSAEQVQNTTNREDELRQELAHWGVAGFLIDALLTEMRRRHAY